MTLKPMRLNGHLHMLSVLVDECSTRKARSKGRCFGRSFTIFEGSLSTCHCCLNYCDSDAIACSGFMVLSASKAMVAVGAEFCGARAVSEVG